MKIIHFLKFSLTLNFILASLSGILFVMLNTIAKKCENLNEIAELSMTSHIVLYKKLKSSEMHDEAVIAREWIQIIYNDKENLGLDSPMWVNYFNYSLSEKIIE